jgi:hypothetical protein
MRDADKVSMVPEPPAGSVMRRAEREPAPSGRLAGIEVSGAPAGLGGSLGRDRLMWLQRGAGNAAVGKLLAAGPRPGVRHRSVTVQRTDPPAGGPEIRQGPIGDVVVPLPNINVVDGGQKKKDWTKGIGAGALLTIPIPKLPGATVGLVGLGEIGATFTAQYGPGRLQNLRVGMTKWQAAQIGCRVVSAVHVERRAGAVSGTVHGAR